MLMEPLTGEYVLAARVAELLAGVPPAGYTLGVHIGFRVYGLGFFAARDAELLVGVPRAQGTQQGYI